MYWESVVKPGVGEGGVKSRNMIGEEEKEVLEQANIELL